MSPQDRQGGANPADVGSAASGPGEPLRPPLGAVRTVVRDVVAPGGSFVVDTPEGIEAFRKLAMLGALNLEIIGLRFKGGRLRASSHVRKILVAAGKDAPRNLRALYDAYRAHLEQTGVLIEDKEEQHG